MFALLALLACFVMFLCFIVARETCQKHCQNHFLAPLRVFFVPGRPSPGILVRGARPRIESLVLNKPYACFACFARLLRWLQAALPRVGVIFCWFVPDIVNFQR